MAQQFFPIDLREADFPLLSEQQPRTIIGGSVGKAPSQDERPGIAYCHNIMPSKEGLDSVAYLPVISPLLGATAPFSDIRTAYALDLSRVYLVWDSLGAVFVIKEGEAAWTAIPATVPATGGAGFDPDSVTIGTVNGVSYIFYAGIGAFNFNQAGNTFDAVTLVGLSIGDILGLTASAGYLVAYTKLAIAWSSTIDPKDFVPSTVTGAGGGNVSGIAGDILFIVANTLGLLVYTKANIIAGTFTGNVQFPWKFREVPGGKGGISLDLIAYEAGGINQFVFSKAGLQQITSSRAEVILPEVTDFLSGKRFEDFNEVTKEYEVTDLTTAPMKKKLKFIAARYLVISYGLTSFTHAIVVDTALQRMGKLKIEHTDCFEYVDAQVEVAKESLAFLLSDGSVSVVDFSQGAASSGVLILGKLQATHSRFMKLLSVQIENASAAATLTVTDRHSLDGKNTGNIEGLLASSNNDLREYVWRTTAKNHSLVFIGKFNAVTVLVRYSIAGRR